MKKILILLLSAAFCTALVFAHSFVKRPNTTDADGKNGGTVINIDYNDYTSYELNRVKSLLEERMSEFGIVILGVGKDWVNIQVYELTDELEDFLVTQIFPEYKSSVVRIELLPENMEIKPA